MMKIQIISDAHYTSKVKCELLNPEADIFVVAGDMFQKPEDAEYYFKSIYNQSEVQCFFVLGNHEYYMHKLNSAVDEYKSALKDLPNVVVLENESVDYNEVKFLGATFWSDLSDPLAALAVKDGLNDYLFIKQDDGHPVNPIDTHAKYKESRTWLAEELESRDLPCVVITHHAPLWECRDTYHDYSSDSRYLIHAFCNRLDTFIDHYRPKYWIHGHTHKSMNFRLGETHVVSNQVGFKHEMTRNFFQRDLVIQID